MAVSTGNSRRRVRLPLRPRRETIRLEEVGGADHRTVGRPSGAPPGAESPNRKAGRANCVASLTLPEQGRPSGRSGIFRTVGGFNSRPDRGAAKPTSWLSVPAGTPRLHLTGPRWPNPQPGSGGVRLPPRSRDNRFRPAGRIGGAETTGTQTEHHRYRYALLPEAEAAARPTCPLRARVGARLGGRSHKPAQTGSPPARKRPHRRSGRKRSGPPR